MRRFDRIVVGIAETEDVEETDSALDGDCDCGVVGHPIYLMSGVGNEGGGVEGRAERRTGGEKKEV